MNIRGLKSVVAILSLIGFCSSCRPDQQAVKLSGKWFNTSLRFKEQMTVIEFGDPYAYTFTGEDQLFRHYWEQKKNLLLLSSPDNPSLFNRYHIIYHGPDSLVLGTINNDTLFLQNYSTLLKRYAISSSRTKQLDTLFSNQVWEDMQVNRNNILHSYLQFRPSGPNLLITFLPNESYASLFSWDEIFADSIRLFHMNSHGVQGFALLQTIEEDYIKGVIIDPYMNRVVELRKVEASQADSMLADLHGEWRAVSKKTFHEQEVLAVEFNTSTPPYEYTLYLDQQFQTGIVEWSKRGIFCYWMI